MMKATNLFVAGTAAVLLPLAAAFAQSPSQTPDPAAQPSPSVPQSSSESQQQPDSQTQSRGATFESLDADSDGKISKAEAESNANVKTQFSRYDVNGDGFIERAEVGQANGEQSTPQSTPPQQ